VSNNVISSGAKPQVEEGPPHTPAACGVGAKRRASTPKLSIVFSLRWPTQIQHLHSTAPLPSVSCYQTAPLEPTRIPGGDHFAARACRNVNQMRVGGMAATQGTSSMPAPRRTIDCPQSSVPTHQATPLGPRGMPGGAALAGHATRHGALRNCCGLMPPASPDASNQAWTAPHP
jgi:hypothetical protein